MAFDLLVELLIQIYDTGATGTGSPQRGAEVRRIATEARRIDEYFSPFRASLAIMWL